MVRGSNAACREIYLNVVATTGVSIASSIPIRLGGKWHSVLLQTTEWGLNMMITGSFKLREAERKAKQGRLGLWRNYVPPAGSSTKQSGKFTGIVTEVRTRSLHLAIGRPEISCLWPPSAEFCV